MGARLLKAALLFTDPTLTRIADAHGKSVARVVLRWLIQRGVIVIPKSVRTERMAESLAVFDFYLTDGQVAPIADLDTGESLLSEHRDPTAVSQLGGYRVNGDRSSKRQDKRQDPPPTSSEEPS